MKSYSITILDFGFHEAPVPIMLTTFVGSVNHIFIYNKGNLYIFVLLEYLILAFTYFLLTNRNH